MNFLINQRRIEMGCAGVGKDSVTEKGKDLC